MTKRVLLLVVIGLGLGVFGQGSRGAQKPTPPGDSVRGSWTVSSWELGYKELEWIERLAKGRTIAITDNELVFEGENNKILIKYILYPKTTPKAVDLNFGKETVSAIYDLNKDQLRICLANNAGNERPKEFKVRTGKDGQWLLTLTRKKN